MLKTDPYDVENPKSTVMDVPGLAFLFWLVLLSGSTWVKSIRSFMLSLQHRPWLKAGQN